MDKLTKRIRCNPDGSMLIKRWDDVVVQSNMQAAFTQTEEESSLLKPPGSMTMADLEEYSAGWETEIEY